MKRRIALCLVLGLLFTLASCTEAKTPETGSGTSTVFTTTPEGEIISDSLGFAMNFPASWDGRIRVEEDADHPAIDVWIDGDPVFSIASLPNDAEIRTAEQTLYAAGYSYFCENTEQTFYWKIDGEVPEDLSSMGRGPVGAVSYTENDIYELFSFYGASAENAEINGWFDVMIEPTQAVYRSDRQGFTLQLPQEWQENCLILPREDSVAVFYKGSSTERIILFQILRGFPDDWGEAASSLIPLAESETEQYYLNCTGEEDQGQEKAAALHPELFENIEGQVREMFSLIES